VTQWLQGSSHSVVIFSQKKNTNCTLLVQKPLRQSCYLSVELFNTAVLIVHTELGKQILYIKQKHVKLLILERLHRSQLLHNNELEGQEYQRINTK